LCASLGVYSVDMEETELKLALCVRTISWKYRRCGSKISCSLNLGTRWRWVVCFILLPPLSLRCSSTEPVDKRLDGPQSQYRHGAEKKFQLPQQDLNPGIPVCNLELS